MADLAGVATLPPQSLGLVDHPIEQSPLVERAELEALGVVTDDIEPEWLRGLFDDDDFKQRFGLSLKPQGSGEALSDAQGRILDLSTQVASLQSRLSELEVERGRLLGRFGPAPEPAPAIAASAPAPAPAPAPAAAAPAAIAPLSGHPAGRRRGAHRRHCRRCSRARIEAPAAQAPAPIPAPAPVDAPAEPSGPAPRFALRRAPAAAKLQLNLGPAKSFRKVGEPAPAPPRRRRRPPRRRLPAAPPEPAAAFAFPPAPAFEPPSPAPAPIAAEPARAAGARAAGVRHARGHRGARAVADQPDAGARDAGVRLRLSAARPSRRPPCLPAACRRPARCSRR